MGDIRRKPAEPEKGKASGAGHWDGSCKGKDSESGRGGEKKQRKQRVCREGMVGPRQEAAVVWGKDPWVQVRILAPPFPAT